MSNLVNGTGPKIYLALTRRRLSLWLRVKQVETASSALAPPDSESGIQLKLSSHSYRLVKGGKPDGNQK